MFRLPAATASPRDAGSRPWADAVAMLARELDAAALVKKTRVGCVVPGRHARYLLVPWNATMQSRGARQVFAEHCFRDTYGDLADGWVVRASTGEYASAALACAIDSALLDELNGIFALRGLALCSVTPSLVHELDTIGDTLPTGIGWVVVPEHGVLTLLLMEDGRPRRVTMTHGMPAQLPQLLSREWFALGREDCWNHVKLCAEHSCALAEAA